MKRGADLPPRRVAGTAEPRVGTTRIAAGDEGDRGPWWLMLGALVLVVLAVLKPWGNGAPASGAGSDDVTAAARAPTEHSAPGTPSPTPVPTPPSADELAAIRCNGPLGWRTYALETWHGQTIRSFVAVDPLATTAVADADDPRLPSVPLIAETVTAIGYCAPTTDEGRPPPHVMVTIWQADATGLLRALPALRIEPAQPSSLMALFTYPSSDRDRRAPWPPGRYLVSVLGLPGSDWGRWFALDVVRFVEASAP